MGWVKAVLVLVVLQSITTSLPYWADAGDLLSPLFSTYSHVFKISGLTDAFHFYSLIYLPSVFFCGIFFDEICNNSVECGKGSCQVSTDDSFGFACNTKNRVALLISLNSLRKLARIPTVERATV
ncbi:hypothetical protein C4D60_Mb07t01870 [Musa balbisiana]|uniref:Uncharacterized protein n=1 Tax=Musa balbisiana TaxID=52838 RepID=A0A4S8JCF2_MUSBA|nr:hypothetical protein C4D60_Mb07t01870 [Musa balbisiana]